MQTFCTTRIREISNRCRHNARIIEAEATLGFSLRLSQRFRAFRAPAAFGARRNLHRDEAGGAAVEFAIVGPVLLMLLSGIFTYGGYFLTAHTVQQLTNDAARAAIAGLDDEERLELAREALASGMSSQRYMRGEVSQLELSRSGPTLSIAVTYDASDDVYWAFQSLVPPPSPRISRRASIRLGGF
jgi:Flp pilus assembly protein TadG